MEPLRIADILELLTTQPDCGTIAMTWKDYLALRADQFGYSSAPSYWRTGPQWRMDKPDNDWGQIFGVPIAIVDG